ncbi:rhomboid family intramembrane serine protease [Methanocella sp. MCL-LM]|uniref:rhomboid family intramembrane serine protease n=1 Tax=Methanocella sp. MCL-LM TaxID=3412035 RepID=UPI003C76EDC3
MADNTCDFCGKHEMLPFSCKYCGGVYCASHRLPEYHNCAGLQAMKANRWVPPVQHPQQRRAAGQPKKGKSRLPKIRLPAQGYYAYILIGLTVLVYIIQMILPFSFTHNYLAFSLSSLFSAPWTIVTQVFAHDKFSIFHLFFNMLALFFFGPLLERQIGSGRFLGLYLGTGILAGLAQVLIFPGTPVLGASGAIMGIMGTLVVLMPNLRIWLFFIPMKLMYAVALFALYDLILLPSGDMVAHAAHLVGLLAGVLVGFLLKKNKGTVQAFWHV